LTGSFLGADREFAFRPTRGMLRTSLARWFCERDEPTVNEHQE
jgi:hypothetical protein